MQRFIQDARAEVPGFTTRAENALFKFKPAVERWPRRRDCKSS